jgi:hypothetical protein
MKLAKLSEENDMNMSDTISELATALAKAQGQIESASKDKSNPAFKSKYADINALRDVIRQPLADNDLSVVQLPRMNGPYERARRWISFDVLPPLLVVCNVKPCR